MDVEVNLWFNLMLFLLWNVVNICFFRRKNYGIRFWRELFLMV